MARMSKGSPRISFQQLPHESISQLSQNNDGRLLKSNSLVQELDLNKIMDDAYNSTFNITRSSTFRQNQQLSFIKSKFLRMIELQNKNVVEKNQLEKERECILREEALKAKNKANRIKDQRSHSGLTSRNWRVKNMQEGAMIRSRKLQNQFLIARRELQDLNSKKNIVNDFHKTSLIFGGKDSDPLRKKTNFYEYRRSAPHQVTQLKVNPKSIQRILNEKKVVMIHESNNWRDNYEE